MVDNLQYINIREVLSRILRHPMLQDLGLEAAIQYSIDFIRIMGLPSVFEEKQCSVEIHDFRGPLPCDLVSIIQVRDHKSKEYLRGMTDSFNGDSEGIKSFSSFKTQGKLIYTSSKEGEVDISYRAIKTDGEGLPMLPDDPVFLRALELYIKKQYFTILFDCGKLASAAILQNTQQEYAFAAGQCQNKFTIPSISEMQSITAMMHQLVPKLDEFNNGFKTIGDKEYIRVQ